MSNKLDYVEFCQYSISGDTLIKPAILTVDRIGTTKNPLGYAEKEKQIHREEDEEEDNIPFIKVPRWKKILSVCFRIMRMF